jgi:hypothetical protein
VRALTKPMRTAPARCATLAAADFVAIVRAGAARERIGLLAPFVLPIFLPGHPSSLDDTLAILTAVVLPTLAFAWGILWARVSGPRLRCVRAIFPHAARGAKATVALVAIGGAASMFALSATIVAARGGAPPLDCLAVARVAFASAFAFAGLGLAHAPRAQLLAFAIPIALGALRTERGLFYALVPNTHAFALTFEPAVGLEAGARFAALLLFGLAGALRFGLSPDRRPLEQPPS